VRLGPGDDCAVVRTGAAEWLLTIDSLVEGTHFRPGWLTAKQIGAKCLAINASDIAAMGGTPRFALVGLNAPMASPASFLDQIQNGIVQAAEDLGVAVVGGNLTQSPVLSVTIALVGEAPPAPVTRSGASPGDMIYVTGRLGEAAYAVRWLEAPHGTPPRTALRRFRQPTAQLAIGRRLATQRIATAMIDVSDGLVQDLDHLCEQSRCAAEVDVGSVPCPRTLRAHPGITLAGGEDYELLFTIHPRRRAALLRIAASVGCHVTCIGKIVAPKAGKRVRLLQTDGREVHLDQHGFDHFRS